MEIEVLSESKTEAEFRIKGERHTFPNLLRDVLLKDPKVEFAAYKLSHPMDSDSLMFVRTAGKTPKKALENALEKISSELEDFSSGLKKALK